MIRRLAIVLSVVLTTVGGGPSAAQTAPDLLSHFYYLDDNAAWESLSRNVAAVGLLSPAWLHIQESGEVRMVIDARVKQLAAQNGVPLMPVVMNEGFRLEAARAAFSDRHREEVISALVRIALIEQFRGLQLDFENLEAADRDAYTQFAEKLSTALRKQKKQLSIAVVSPLYSPVPSSAKTESWQPTPHSSAFDYQRLAHAAEFVTLMTYDQYTSPGAPGPVAGIEWMEACIRKTLEYAPPSKIMLGVPLYHRHWADQKVTTGAWSEARELSEKADTKPVFDELHQENVLRFQIDGGSHVIWYHDVQSVRRRWELASKYRLRGFSAWRIGQEDPSLWPLISPRVTSSRTISQEKP